jgi:uncharacterized membrane protein
MNRQLFFTLDVLSLVCIAFMLATGLFYYSSLPEQMPIHFDSGGQADDYGPRAMIFLLPGIAIATSVLVGLIGRDPKNYNFPVKVTDENRVALIGESRLLVSGIMFVTNLLLAYIHWGILQIGLGHQTGLNATFIWLFIGAILLLTVNGYVRMKKLA